MSAPEKAKELVQRFADVTPGYPFDLGKRCALIFVDQHMVEISPGGNRVFWKKVKNEIEKL